jgi:hypothetical protein
MQNARFVRCAKSICSANEQFGNLLPVAWFAPRPIVEGSTVYEFHNEIWNVFEFASIVHRENVRMVQRRRELHFALEPFAQTRIAETAG